MKSITGKCIILSAPSGAGKTTIVRRLLLSFPELTFSISATSRASRTGETDGVDYYFLSTASFRQKIQEGKFLEWEEVYTDQYYGTLKEEVERIWSLGKTVVFDVDVVGGINLKQYFGDKALALFVQPPSITVLAERLRLRSTESFEHIEMRLAKAAEELEYAPRFDQIVVNDALEEASAESAALVRKFLDA